MKVFGFVSRLWFASVLVAAALFSGNSLRAAETVLVEMNADWMFYSQAEPPPAGWNQREFDASEWKHGKAPLGYGDPGLETVIETPDNTARPITIYFRATFQAPDLFNVSHIVGHLVRDDGAVVYLNGREIFRSNMPDVEIMPDTLASMIVGGEAETTPVRFDLNATLSDELNVLAVEVHQANPTSSDARLALELVGTDVVEPNLPVLSIEATRPVTSEPTPTSRIAPGVFTIRRSEVTDTAFTAWVAFGGTATAGADYDELPTRVEFEAGATEVVLQVGAKSDELVEGNETVVAELILPPTAGPLPAEYRIHPERRRAVVTINDADKPARAHIEITEPENGNTFLQGEKIVINAVAVDPAGYISRVEFFDGDQLIGVSEIVFVTAPEPGTPIEHTFEWTDAGLGDHRLTARSASPNGTQVISEPVLIHVVHSDPPPQSVLSIEATRPITSEPLSNANALIAPGLFTIRRVGAVESAFTAWVTYAGTAKPSEDYKELPATVEFKAGQTTATLEVLAQSDDLIEGDETVVAELTLPPTAGAVAAGYRINPDRRRAVVTIKDEDKPAPVARIEIKRPENGATIPLGTKIVITAVAVDPAGYIPRLEFFDGDKLLGVSQVEFIRAPDPGTPIEHHFEWEDATVGEHTLTARGVDANGQSVTSDAVIIHVVHVDPPPTIVSIHTISDPREIVWPDADYASDWFEIRRTGPATQALTVFFDVADVSSPEIHLATPGVDYKEIKETILIPEGVQSVTIKVEAIDDQLVEGAEQVHLILKPVPPNADPAGGGIYAIDPEHREASVIIHDNDRETSPDPLRLAVEVVDGVASEIGITAVIDPAVFRIKRVDGPKIRLMAYYTMTGTASNGIDYQKLNGTVEIPADADYVDIRVNPIYDKALEGEETVILTLEPPVCPAIHPPPPECYEIAEPASGRAVIVDMQGEEFAVRIASPRNGAVFTVGQVIEIEANASGDVTKLEISVDGVSLGVTTEKHLTARWTDATVGGHTIQAEAISASGQETKAEIKILVRERDAGAFVFRKLPDAYTPGTAFGVELRAEPPDGTRAYAIEDRPPTGWTVSAVSDGGSYDAATGKVKFGPFTDTNERTLTYRLTPPANATGPREFSGTGSVDGANYPIAGDRVIRQSATHHPADTNQNFVMVVNEVTAYAAAWKGGEDIPISYVSRAGYLWKSGEAYEFNGVKQPPLCWVPVNGNGEGDIQTAASVMETERSGVGETRPGVTSTMTIRITPPAGTKAYALEEHLPVGWTVSNISHEGTFDAAKGIIRWGVFFDATARTFTYNLTPPPGIAVVARFNGKVSFDGVVREITGRERLVSSDQATRPELRDCERDGLGKVRLQLIGAVGQVGVLQGSGDLIHWEDIATVYLPDGTVEFEDDAGANSNRYYRLQVR